MAPTLRAPEQSGSTTAPLQFIRRGQIQGLGNVPPTRTLLELLRDDLGQTGTKEGCRSGDCGACTVVLGQPDGQGGLHYRAVNSCIQLAHAAQGQALWTVEDLTADPMLQRAPTAASASDSRPFTTAANTVPCTPPQPGLDHLHPVQQALVQHHASQCGFCTPGFVMSLFALYQNRVAQASRSGTAPEPVSRDQALEALSGNLCRCTGYRPILQAAQTMLNGPLCSVNEAEILQKTELLALSEKAQEANFSYKKALPSYLAPTSLTALLQARAHDPQAQLVAGCTDVGLWITKGHQTPARILDLTRAAELRRVRTLGPEENAAAHDHSNDRASPGAGSIAIDDYASRNGWLEIGAAVSLTDAFAALVASRPALAAFASRFAGLPVRNAGTLGGNVANGSPIGDSMPLLIALGAQVRLMRWNSTTGQADTRELPLERLYTGYRQNVLAPDELLTHILVPPPGTTLVPQADATVLNGEWLRAYKISKRFEDDISAVCLGLRLTLRDGVVTQASLGVGGVAATPVRAVRTEAALIGEPWTQASAAHAASVLQAEFSPISDMRASAHYRRTVLGNLLQRAWAESTGIGPINLEHADLAQLTGAAA